MKKQNLNTKAIVSKIMPLDQYIKEVNTEQAVKLDLALGFVEHFGSLSEKDRQRIDKMDFGKKKGPTENRKSLISNGSGGRI